MRKGEAAAHKWSDIDFKNKTISINETLDFTAKDKSELFGDTKTFRSTRTITNSQSLSNDLRYHMNWQNQNKLALINAYHHDLNLVLCREDGKFMPKSSLYNAFSRILKRAELPPVADPFAAPHIRRHIAREWRRYEVCPGAFGGASLPTPQKSSPCPHKIKNPHA